MCVILHCKRNARPSLELLAKCAAANRDGIGIAWPTSRGAQWAKGISLDQLVRLLDVIPGDVAIHFRLASSGGSMDTLCHPFPIGGGLHMAGRAPACIMHNGHLGDGSSILAIAGANLAGPVSDTRAIAHILANRSRMMLKRLPGVWTWIGRRSIETYGKMHKVAPGITASNTYWQRPECAYGFGYRGWH